MQTRTLGIVIVILGIIMMIYTGFNYVTTEKVVDIGPVEINKEKNNPVRWSPFLGGALIVGGFLLMATSKKK